MAKLQHISTITKKIPLEKLDYYELFQITFENGELGRMKRLFPLHEMAVSFGLVSKRHERKRGLKPYFSLEGMVTLMFLKNDTQLGDQKLLEQLNGNVHNQIFCDFSITSPCPQKDYKQIDDMALNLQTN